MRKTTPVTFCLKIHWDGTITKAHTEHLWLAQLDDWEMPKDKKGRPASKVTYADPVNSSSDESSDKEEPLNNCQKVPAKRMQGKDRTDKLDNDDTSAED